MLQDLGSDHFPILLTVPLSPVFRPNERTHFFNFQKAVEMTLPITLTLTVLLERNTRLFLYPLLLLSLLLLTLNAPKLSISFGRIKCQSQAWWFAEVEEAVSKICKTFAAAHRSDEDRRAYISAYRRASSVMANAKAEAWHATCSSLSCPNLTQNLCTLSFVLSLPLLPLLTSQLFLYQGVGFGLRRLPEIPLFCLPVKDLA